ncbi:MAG TPA: carbohydrate kinase family protein [Propylenella sp.]
MTPSILVVGDVMIDIVVNPEGPITLGADRLATIRMLPGGSGANQAAWLATEKVKVAYVGRVGRAEHQRQTALLTTCGVNAFLAVDDVLPTGTTVTMLSRNGERSFFTDRGANDRLRSADLPDALLDGVGLVLLSGYSFYGEGSRAAVLDLLAETRRRNIPFAIDPASHSFLRQAGPRNFLDWFDGARICFPNAVEAALLSGSEDVGRQLQFLTRSFSVVVIKRGAEGAIAAEAGNSQRWKVSAARVKAVDTTGAGDAFVAGFLGAYSNGLGLEACLRRAVELGTQSVMRLGGRPPADTVTTILPRGRGNPSHGR